ncbi:MAG: ribbon-helix-helix protein, CopG family [Gemmatimonadetes bacterium]|nr:ribbon-helix-helix protein, CopG family [Gemmatimonadota bacterium]
MRTTVRLEDDILRRAKERAVASGTTLTGVIREALQAYLARPVDAADPCPVALPVSGSGGTLPGIDLDDTASLYDVMDGRT